MKLCSDRAFTIEVKVIWCYLSDSPIDRKAALPKNWLICSSYIEFIINEDNYRNGLGLLE